MTPPIRLTVWFDGGCHPNPGGVPRYGWHCEEAGAGRLADGKGRVVGLSKEANTNNTAEFAALRAALEWVSHVRVPVERLEVFGDSRLVVDVMNGGMGLKKPHLRKIADECRVLLAECRRRFKVVILSWRSREENCTADSLAGSCR